MRLLKTTDDHVSLPHCVEGYRHESRFAATDDALDPVVPSVYCCWVGEVEVAECFVQGWSVVFGGVGESSVVLNDADDCVGIHTVHRMTTVETAVVVAADVEGFAIAAVPLSKLPGNSAVLDAVVLEEAVGSFQPPPDGVPNRPKHAAPAKPSKKDIN